MRELQTLNYDDCKDWVNRQFVLPDPDTQQSLSLVLEDAEPRGAVNSENARQSFSLVFSGPLEPILPQRVYCLANAETGTLELFLVPIGPSGDRQQYEAIFT